MRKGYFIFKWHRKIWLSAFKIVFDTYHAFTLNERLNKLNNKAVWGFPGGSEGKESTCNAGDLGSIPGLGRSPGDGNGNPLQCCLENSMERGAWQAIVHGVAKSQTRPGD